MMLRILFAGALVGLPFLVFSAHAETAAIPAASSTPSAAPAGSASPPAPTNGTTSAASPTPATPDSLVSPFLPAPDVATPPPIGGGSTPSNPPPAAAPLRRHAAPVPAKPWRRSRRRSLRPRRPEKPRSPTIPTPTLEPDTFFATAKASERYSAIVDAGGWPTDIVAIGPGTKGPAVANLRKRLAIEGDLDPRQASGLGVGRRADRGGETLPVAHGVAPDRSRGRRDAEGDQRSGVGALQPARLQRQSFGRAQFFLRPALCRRQFAFDLGRGGRERAGGSPLRRDRRRSRASLARNLGPYPGHQPQPDLDGPDLDHQEGNHSQNAARSRLPDARQDPDSRRLGPGDQSAHRQLEHGTGGQLHAEAGFRGGQFARLDPHRHAQQTRRLYARHAVQGSVRRRLPVPQPRLRQGAGRL